MCMAKDSVRGMNVEEKTAEFKPDYKGMRAQKSDGTVMQVPRVGKVAMLNKQNLLQDSSILLDI